MVNIVNLDNYNVDPDVYSLSNLLQGVLDRVVSLYASYGVPLPTRQYWTMGTPAADCEQLVVNFIQMYLGSPGDEASEPQRCNVPRSAVMAIQIFRAVPSVGQSGQAPTAAKIQAGAVLPAVDAWTLMSAVNLLDQWEEGGYGPGVIATLTAQEAQGGFQSTTLQITMAVP